MPPHHVPNMQLGRLVVGEVLNLIATGHKFVDQRVEIIAVGRGRETDKDSGTLRALIAIVELGDVSATEHATKTPERARLLRD